MEIRYWDKSEDLQYLLEADFKVGNGNYYTGSYSQIGGLTKGMMVGTSDIHFNGNLTAKPNPTVDNIELKLESNKYHDVQFRLYSINGQLMDIENKSGSNINYYMDLSNESSGIYTIQLIIDGKIVEAIKIVKQ